MGRRKGYDRDAVLTSAMELFREHGFAGTSAERLVEHLGVNRYSLYAEFGSKQGLFDAALARYEAEVVGRSFAPLEAPDAGLDTIRTLFRFYAAARDGRAFGRGCLLCNTAVELGPTDPSGAGFVPRYFERLSSAFRNVLSNAQAAGGLRPGVVPAREAAFFTSAVLGLFVLLRGRAPGPLIEAAAEAAIEHLEHLASEPVRPEAR